MNFIYIKESKDKMNKLKTFKCRVSWIKIEDFIIKILIKEKFSKHDFKVILYKRTWILIDNKEEERN